MRVSNFYRTVERSVSLYLFPEKYFKIFSKSFSSAYPGKFPVTSPLYLKLITLPLELRKT